MTASQCVNVLLLVIANDTKTTLLPRTRMNDSGNHVTQVCLEENSRRVIELFLESEKALFCAVVKSACTQLLLRVPLHSAVGGMTMKSTRRVLGHSLLRLLVRSHCSLILFLSTARFARELRCAHSFARSLTHSLRSSWERALCLWNERVDFISFLPTPTVDRR